MNCVHTHSGLCPECQAEYNEDPLSWLEYGQHPEGIARWKALQDEMAQEADRVRSALPPDDSIPF